MHEMPVVKNERSTTRQRSGPLSRGAYDSVFLASASGGCLGAASAIAGSSLGHRPFLRASSSGWLRSRELTAKAVRLFHFAWVVQRVRGARMFVMEEDGKLRSYGFALRRHCLFEEMILQFLGQVAP
jgi:hypothetical protein